MTNPKGTNIPNFNRLNEWPLQFMRTGHYIRSHGYLLSRRIDGYWWSSVASSATNGRHLGSSTGTVHALGNSFRGYGFSIRCVAR